MPGVRPYQGTAHPGIAGAGEIINKRNRKGLKIVRSA